MKPHDSIEPERGTVPPRPELSSVISNRAAPVIRAMSQASALTLLIGAAGSGKAYLAGYVADQLQAAGDVRSIVLPHPSGASAEPVAVFGAAFPEVFAEASGDDDRDPGADGARGQEHAATSGIRRAERIAEAVIASIRKAAGDAEPLLVLPGVDRYSALSSSVLERLLSEPGLRLIATAHRLVAGASRIARVRRATQITIGPLNLHEADALLSYLLRVSHIAPETLHRWHAVTGGNSYAMRMLMLANERGGTLRKRGGFAWVPEGLDEIPDEFGAYIDENCSEAERATLELIALTEPMIEPPLLRLLDPAATSALLERDIVSSRRHPGGQSALSITHPIISEAVKNRMSPLRRIELAELCFQALEDETPNADPRSEPRYLVTKVLLGLESGRALPQEWLSGALSALSTGGDPQLVLRISLALARGFASEASAAAALRAVSFSAQLGDAGSLEAAHDAIEALVADVDACELLPAPLLTRLLLVRIERRFQTGTAMAEVQRQLDRIEESLAPDDLISLEEVRAVRFWLLLNNGNLTDAAAVRISDEASEDITIEWVRVSARSGFSLLLQQQGRLEEAVRIADRARTLSMIGKRPLNDSIEVQSFCWFLSYWASGSSAGGERALDEIELQVNSGLHARIHQPGLIEAGRVMIAAQEGRWRDAADLAELLVERFEASDPYGVVPLLSAVQSLALAALGEHEPALRALVRARVDRRGLARAAGGFRRRLILQAQQWLGIGDTGAEALRLAQWAESQGLRLIELEALHLAATSSKAMAARILPRAWTAASAVDPVVGGVIIAHIEKIANGVSPSDVSEPEVRLLADLGLWTPLPRVSGMSAREREVALLASLGYSSRFIAERLFLSVRTVETHLAHVYSKLGLADRDELRRWFSVDRAIQESGYAA